jgi:hypothetical protein
MGRVAIGGVRVNVDVVYEDFTEALTNVPGAYALVAGRLGGSMAALAANRGEFWLTGAFTIDMAGESAVELGMYAHIGGSGANAVPSDGYANITYNVATYQFTLPIEPIDGISGHPAAAPSPIIPARTDVGDWRASTGAYPVPLSEQAPDPECSRNWAEYTISECPGTIAP